MALLAFEEARFTILAYTLCPCDVARRMWRPRPDRETSTVDPQGVGVARRGGPDGPSEAAELAVGGLVGGAAAESRGVG